jgi:hypothetical protein
MDDMQGYLGALQSTQMAQELFNQKLELLQQKKESTLPLSEMFTAEGGKSLLEQGFNAIKNSAKDFARAKMKEAGIDDDTINSVLQGNFTDAIQSKVTDLINQAKSTGEEAVSQVRGAIEGAVDEASTTLQNLSNQVSSTIEDAQGMLTDTIDNISSTVRDNIATAQGIQDDLTAQALQEYNPSISLGEISLSDIETNTSNLFQRFMSSVTPQVQDVEMVNMANISAGAESSLSDITSSFSNLLSGGGQQISEAVSGVSDVADVATGAALEGIGAAADFLGPIGAIAGLALGIFGIVESEKTPEIQQPILNPSAQFL